MFCNVKLCIPKVAYPKVLQNYVVLAQLTVIAKLRFARTDRLRLSKSFACVRQTTFVNARTLQNQVLYKLRFPIQRFCVSSLSKSFAKAVFVFHVFAQNTHDFAILIFSFYPLTLQTAFRTLYFVKDSVFYKIECSCLLLFLAVLK